MENEIAMFAPDGYIFKEARDGKLIFRKTLGLPRSWEEIQDHRIDMTEFEWEKWKIANGTLCKLVQLRDVYRQGWVPDWTNEEEVKYCVIVERGRPVAWEETTVQHVLSFQSADILDEFMHNFEGLIEIAKDFL